MGLFNGFERSPVESEKDEVSLIVESSNLSTYKLRILWEKSSK